MELIRNNHPITLDKQVNKRPHIERLVPHLAVLVDLIGLNGLDVPHSVVGVLRGPLRWRCPAAMDRIPTGTFIPSTTMAAALTALPCM